MNRKPIITLTIMVVTLRMSCLGQINDFKDILTHPVKNKVFQEKKDSIDSERAFLGLIKDGSGKIVFYVAKEFYTVRAAVVRHGHSRIIFFDNHKKLTASYWIVSELPYMLVNNTIYFKYENSNPHKTVIFKDRIGSVLPDHICVKINDCYTAEIAEEKN